MAKRIAAFAGLLVLSCSAPDEPAPGIAIDHGWARETAPGQSAAAAYLTIANTGDGDDRLVEVDARGVGAASLHSTSNAGGVARMRALDGGLEIPAHSNVELKPGGTHIMLTGLRQPLRAGQAVNLNLGFARSGRLPLAVRVQPATADDPHSGHGMSR